MPTFRAATTRLLRDPRLAFVVVGGTNTLLFFVLFATGYTLVGHLLGYMGCLVLSYFIAIICAFFLHRRFVFRVKGQLWLDLGRFILVNLSALGINLVLLPVLVELAHLPVIAAQLLVVAITVTLSYFGHLWFSFHRRAPDHPVPPRQAQESSPGQQ